MSKTHNFRLLRLRVLLLLRFDPDVAVVGRPGYVKRGANVIDVQCVIIMQFSGRPHLSFLQINGRTASESSTGTSGGNTRLGPLLNQATFELG